MKGHQITFYTEQSRRHHGKLVSDWLIGLVDELQLPGATVLGCSEGIGEEGRLHAARFLELADQPLMVVMIVSDKNRAELMARIQKDGPRLFYVEHTAEYGMLNAPASAP